MFVQGEEGGVSSSSSSSSSSNSDSGIGYREDGPPHQVPALHIFRVIINWFFLHFVRCL